MSDLPQIEKDIELTGRPIFKDVSIKRLDVLKAMEEGDSIKVPTGICGTWITLARRGLPDRVYQSRKIQDDMAHRRIWRVS